MSQENVALVREMYEDFGPATFEAKLGRINPDLEWRTSGMLVDAEVFRGRDDVLAFLTRFWSEFDEIAVVVEELIDAGERVVAVCRFRARGKASGVMSDMSLSVVWTFSGGEVTRVDNFRERAQALEAVGLRE